MPAILQLNADKREKSQLLHKIQSKVSVALPLPPLATQVQYDRKVTLTVDLAQPIGLRLNNECRVVEIFSNGQFGNVATGVRVGYVIDMVEEAVVLSYKDFKIMMKTVRDRGDNSVKIRCRPPKELHPVRPYILQSLKNLDSQDDFELNYKDVNVNISTNKSTSQMVYTRGMKPFRAILRHVESGDYTWDCCPPRAKHSLETSRTNIEAAARQRYGPACNHLGMLYATGIHPSPKDTVEAANWFKIGSKYNDPDAQYNYAIALYNGIGVDKDHASAAQWLIKSAGNGHAFAQSLSGLVYTHGSGVPTNIIKASSMWKDAARQREPEAEYRLGAAFQHAVGFSNRNPQLAEELFRRAAAAGQAEASTVVGRLLQQDPATLDTALSLTSIGAKNAHPPAMYDLGVMYHEGLKLPKDDTAAFAWLMGAARKEHALACRLVAEALYEGWGGEEQLEAVKAHKIAVERLHSKEFNSLEGEVCTARRIEREWIEAQKRRQIEARKLRELQIMEERKRKFDLEKEEEERRREAEAAAIVASEAAKAEEKAKLVALEEERARLEAAIREKLAVEAREEKRLANEKAEAICLAIKFEEDLKQKERCMLIENEKKEELRVKLELKECCDMKQEDIDYGEADLGSLTKIQRVRAKFHFFDVDKIGKVKSYYIGELLQAYGLNLTPNRFDDILELYKKYSPYFQSGFLSLHEVKKLCIIGESVFRFDQLDIAKDGNLAEDDFQDFMDLNGVSVSLEQCTSMIKSISTDGDGVVSLDEFVDFFRYLPVETRLKAEAEVLIAKAGVECQIDLSLKLGMMVNPNCQVSKVTEGGQAELQGIKVGCIIKKCGGEEVTSLAMIKSAIAKAKEQGCLLCPFHFLDPRRIAATAAALGALKAQGCKLASKVAEEEAIEAKKSRRRTQLIAAAIARENEDGRFHAQQKVFESKLKRCFLDVSQGGLEGIVEEDKLPILFEKMELGLKPKEMTLTLKYGLDSRRKSGVGLSLTECKAVLRVARLILAFNDMDADKSGFISEDELLATFNKLGFHIKPEICSVIMRKMDPNGDGVVSLDEFVDFFRYLPVELHLRAEGEVLQAKAGEVCSLDLRLKLGMLVNPNGVISKITSGSQCEAMDVTAGCRVVACGGKPVQTLKDIKAAIAEAKERGLTNCPLHFYDPRKEARAVAQLAKLRVDASQAAVIAAQEAEVAAERTRKKREQEAREIEDMHKRQRQEAVEAAQRLAETHEQERLLAIDNASKIAESNRLERLAAEEEALKFANAAKLAQEAAAAEIKRLAEEEGARRAQEERERSQGLELKHVKEVALKKIHQIQLAEVEARKLKEAAILKAKMEAFSWWEKSSALGCLDASNDLATCLAYGNGCQPDVKRAKEVWEDAIQRGHVPSLHHFAMAFINHTGVNLRFAGGPYGNLERATELLVAAASKGYKPSQEYLFKAQPLSFQTADDFKPKPMPLMCFADLIVGRRVQVCNYKEGDIRYTFNGWYGTVESVKPAVGKFIVRMQDYTVMSFSRSHLCRPFIAILSEDLVKVPPPLPEEKVIRINPCLALGIDAESDTLLIVKVDPTSQAWEQGVRPGQSIHTVAGVKVEDLDSAAQQLQGSKERGDKVCEVSVLVYPMERHGGLF